MEGVDADADEGDDCVRSRRPVRSRTLFDGEDIFFLSFFFYEIIFPVLGSIFCNRPLS